MYLKSELFFVFGALTIVRSEMWNIMAQYILAFLPSGIHERVMNKF